MGEPDGADTDQPGRSVAPDPVPPAGRPEKTPDKTPDKTGDELDVGWGERPRDPDRLSENDERLLRERPPHWE